MQGLGCTGYQCPLRGSYVELGCPVVQEVLNTDVLTS